jgi:large subunit ribosomal protein L30
VAEATPKKAAKPRTTKPKAKATAKPKASTAGQARLRVKQVRSGIGHAETYRRTLEALGLRHHQHEIVIVDSPTARGMLFKVRHLVQVSEEA